MKDRLVTKNFLDKLWDDAFIGHSIFNDTPVCKNYTINTNKDTGTITLAVKLPGHNKDTINVELLENRITITAKSPEKSNSFIEDIELKFSVSEGYDGTMASGSITDGILVITLERPEKKRTKTLKLLS